MLFRLVAPRPRIRRDGEVLTVAHPAAANLLYRIVPAIVFAVATLVPLLAFDWPPVTRSMAIAIAIALIVARFTIALGRLLVTLVTLPRADGGREVSLAQALFWFRRCAIFVIYFAFGWAAIQVMVPLGFSIGARYFVAYVLGIGLFLIAIEAVWSRPSEDRPRSVAVSWGLTLYFALLWILWVTGFNFCSGSASMRCCCRACWLSPRLPSARSIRRRQDSWRTRRIAAVLLDRGVRAIIIAVAAVWFGRMLGLAADRMAAGDTMVDRITRGALGGIVILLAADLLWHLARAYINGKLDESRMDAAATDEEKAKRARLQTLLPIFRNILAVVIAVIAVLMVLSGLGVADRPADRRRRRGRRRGRLRRADDRQGRHQRHVLSVGRCLSDRGVYRERQPQGCGRSLQPALREAPPSPRPADDGAVSASSERSRTSTATGRSTRSRLNVTYNTDLVKAKKVIKQIGQQLLDNPEFEPHIIETLEDEGRRAVWRIRHRHSPGDDDQARRAIRHPPQCAGHDPQLPSRKTASSSPCRPCRFPAKGAKLKHMQRLHASCYKSRTLPASQRSEARDLCSSPEPCQDIPPCI